MAYKSPLELNSVWKGSFCPDSILDVGMKKIYHIYIPEKVNCVIWNLHEQQKRYFSKS